MPIRIQRSRAKGSKLPPNTVCVTRPGPFGNPWKPDERTTAACCVASFRRCLVRVRRNLPMDDTDPWGKPVPLAMWAHFVEMAHQLDRLKGKSLACWCPIGSPCHSDVLLELANPKGGA